MRNFKAIIEKHDDGYVAYPLGLKGVVVAQGDTYKTVRYNCRGGITMRHAFTLEFWRDEGWYVGRLKEVPGIFSQGETLEELEDNIRDAYELVLSDAAPVASPVGAESKPIEVEV